MFVINYRISISFQIIIKWQYSAGLKEEDHLLISKTIQIYDVVISSEKYVYQL